MIDFFSATGASQSFVVPAGVFSLQISASGGGGGRTNELGKPSGRGDGMTGTLAVTPGETLTLDVGRAGGSAGGGSIAGTRIGGWPDGGDGGLTASTSRHGGGGGGSTAIYRGATPLLICGGGGGGQGRPNFYSTVGDATSPVAFDGGPLPIHGGGATTVSGGVAGTGASAGSSGSGGNGQGGSGTENGGGGGGGGLFGGGGGGKSFTSAGRGGGGTSYISPTGWSSVTWATRTGSVTETVTFLTGFNGTIRIEYVLPTTLSGWSLGLNKFVG